jgi:hypothetical protein
MPGTDRKPSAAAAHPLFALPDANHGRSFADEGVEGDPGRLTHMEVARSIVNGAMA